MKDVELNNLVDQIYTCGEEILSRHSDPASYMTTQHKNLFGISHNWNPVLRGSDEQKQIIQAKKDYEIWKLPSAYLKCKILTEALKIYPTPMRMTPKRKKKNTPGG